MKNKLGTVFKRIVFAFGIIYGIDVILKNTGINIPINYITVAITTILGVPGLLSLLFLLVFI